MANEPASFADPRAAERFLQRISHYPPAFRDAMIQHYGARIVDALIEEDFFAEDPMELELASEFFGNEDPP